MTVQEALHRNGVIIERARREGRSLSREERSIILAGRAMAWGKEMVRHRMNALEMEGERDRETVLKPTKVEATFAYYDDPYEEIPAEPAYFVRESNHPALPTNGHVCAQQLIDAGQKVPKTMSYEQWINSGRPVVRS